MSSKAAVTKKAAKKAAQKRQATPKAAKPKKVPHHILALQSESVEILDRLKSLEHFFAAREAQLRIEDAEHDARVEEWKKTLAHSQQSNRLIQGCYSGGGAVSFTVEGEELPQPLALKAADIDYEGWEAVSMVGIDAITDERRGRRGRRGLFAALGRDEYKRKLVTLHIREQYEASEPVGASIVAAAGEPGRFERILKFIYDHREEILAFVQRIVELFAGMPV